MDIYEYIKNSNNKFDKVNTLDALILTRLSYLHFEKILNKLPISISSLYNNLSLITNNKKDIKLITLLSKSDRFKDMVITRCLHIDNVSKEERLTAITILLPKKEIFISFRGTTKNAYDFKEDMNMSYKIVPSCLDATNYVKKEKDYSKLYIGGHSKGGHIAMYVASHVNYFIRKKIVKVYNFDGPGFLSIDDNFNKVKDKIISYLPTCSIVGRIMNNDSKIIPIKTNKQGIEAHSLYNWKVDNNGLVISKLSKNSDEFHTICLKVLEVIPSDKREEIINYFFSLILKGEINSIKELNITKVRSIINKIPHPTKEEKEVLMSFFKVLIKCSIPKPRVIKKPKKIKMSIKRKQSTK